MSCTSLLPNGNNSNCEVYLKEVYAALIFKAGTSGYTPEELDNLDTIKTAIAGDENAVVVEFNGTEPTMAEAQTETTGFGTSYITSENSPTLLAYTKNNACDFSDILDSFTGGTYEVYNYDRGGNLIGTRNNDKSYGFKTQVFAHAYGAVGRDNQTQQYRITFNYLDETEWRNVIVTPVNYSLFDIKDQMPLGLTAPHTIELDASGEASIKIHTRCDSTDVEDDTLTTEYIKTNADLGDTPVVTATYNATTSLYDIVATIDGATAPSFGQYIEVKFELVDSGTLTKVTNIVKLKGNS